jgi:hypothetical protein
VTYDNVKEFADYDIVDEELKSTAYFADPVESRQHVQMKTLMAYWLQYIPKIEHYRP